MELDNDTEIYNIGDGMSGFHEVEFLSNLLNQILQVITSIGESHMQDLGSREGIAKS